MKNDQVHTITSLDRIHRNSHSKRGRVIIAKLNRDFLEALAS